jgi:hypothetical protein
MPNDAKMFYKLFLGGLLTVYLVSAFFGLTLAPEVSFEATMVLSAVVLMFAFFPVLFVSLIRAFLISKLQSPRLKAFLTFALSLLFGTPGIMFYIIVVVSAAIMTYYSYKLEET